METKDNRIRIILEGLPEDGGLVRAGALAQELDAITGILKHLDRTISKAKKLSFYLRITELKYKSPMLAELEAVSFDPSVDNRVQVIRGFSDIGASIRDGTISEKRFDYALIMQVRELLNPAGKDFKSLRVSTSMDEWTITEDYRRTLDSALLPEETSPGYLDGLLEYINIHGEQNVFKIYPDVGPNKITCHFQKEQREAAIKAIGQRVTVRGKLKFKAISEHPHEIIVDEIEVFPPANEIPNLNELWGIAPDLTGGLSIADFLEKVRNE